MQPGLWKSGCISLFASICHQGFSFHQTSMTGDNGLRRTRDTLDGNDVVVFFQEGRGGGHPFATQSVHCGRAQRRIRSRASALGVRGKGHGSMRTPNPHQSPRSSRPRINTVLLLENRGGGGGARAARIALQLSIEHLARSTFATAFHIRRLLASAGEVLVHALLASAVIA